MQIFMEEMKPVVVTEKNESEWGDESKIMAPIGHFVPSRLLVKEKLNSFSLAYSCGGIKVSVENLMAEISL